MTKKFSVRAFYIIILGFLGSCMIGYLAHGPEIFNPRLVSFQFVISGAISSVLVAVWASGRPLAVVGVAVGLIALFLAVSQPATGARVLRDLTYLPTLVASVWLARFSCSKVKTPTAILVLFWGISFAVCHLAVLGFLSISNGVPFSFEQAQISGSVGGLVGVGVGLGVYIASRLRYSEEKPTPSAREA